MVLEKAGWNPRVAAFQLLPLGFPLPLVGPPTERAGLAARFGLVVQFLFSAKLICMGNRSNRLTAIQKKNRPSRFFGTWPFFSYPAYPTLNGPTQRRKDLPCTEGTDLPYGERTCPAPKERTYPQGTDLPKERTYPTPTDLPYTEKITYGLKHASIRIYIKALPCSHSP